MTLGQAAADAVLRAFSDTISKVFDNFVTAIVDADGDAAKLQAASNALGRGFAVAIKAFEIASAVAASLTADR